MTPSELPYLELASIFYGTIFIGFGILWFVNAPKALSFFELPYPSAPAKPDDKAQQTAYIQTQQLIDLFAIVYGIRDVFMGVTLYTAALCGTRQVLGWITLAAGLVAAVDGVACKWVVGKGEMNHWGYAPHVVVVGGVLLGFFEWVPLDAIFGWFY